MILHVNIAIKISFTSSETYTKIQHCELIIRSTYRHTLRTGFKLIIDGNLWVCWMTFPFASLALGLLFYNPLLRFYMLYWQLSYTLPIVSYFNFSSRVPPLPHTQHSFDVRFFLIRHENVQHRLYLWHMNMLYIFIAFCHYEGLSMALSTLFYHELIVLKPFYLISIYFNDLLSCLNTSFAILQF